MWLLAHRGLIHDDPDRRHGARSGELRHRRPGRARAVPGALMAGAVARPVHAASYRSWGRYPSATPGRGVPGRLALRRAAVRARCAGPVLPYACGRSYGDSCLNDGGLLLDVRAARPADRVRRRGRTPAVRGGRDAGRDPGAHRAARLVPAGGARHPLGVGGRRHRERHPRQEPSPCRDVRRPRDAAGAPALERRADRLRAGATRCSRRRSADSG